MSGLPRSCHALVTGGARGIGREIATALSAAGAVVTVLGRHRAGLDDVVAAGAASRVRRGHGVRNRQRIAFHCDSDRAAPLGTKRVLFLGGEQSLLKRSWPRALLRRAIGRVYEVSILSPRCRGGTAQTAKPPAAR